MDLDKLLHEKGTSPSRKGYVNAKGFTIPERYEELKEEIENFEVNEEDVWICSFPKTGTTWTQEMVWLILNNLDFEKAKEDIDSRSPFLEFSVVGDLREFLKNNPDANPPKYRVDSLGYTKSLKSPVVVKTHLPFVLLPSQIRNDAKKPKIVYITREPKDTCVSYYHHSQIFENFSGNFEEFSRLFLGGKINYAPFWDHVLQFWKLRNQKNFLFLRFEDMKRDLPSVVREVAQFLERPLGEDQVKLLAEHLTFEKMKTNPAVNREKNFSSRKSSEKRVFMRSGTVGDHMNAMSEECTKKFEEWIKNNLKETDFVI